MVRAQRENGDKIKVRIFENISVLQQFLLDSYWEINDTPEFTKNPLKIHFIDIETYSPDDFPVPDKAKDTVNVITSILKRTIRTLYQDGIVSSSICHT